MLTTITIDELTDLMIRNLRLFKFNSKSLREFSVPCEVQLCFVKATVEALIPFESAYLYKLGFSTCVTTTNNESKEMASSLIFSFKLSN